MGNLCRPDAHMDLVEIGSAVYPKIATSCNHSCDPSTVRVKNALNSLFFLPVLCYFFTNHIYRDQKIYRSKDIYVAK